MGSRREGGRGIGKGGGEKEREKMWVENDVNYYDESDNVR